jgi:hypothetical protein
MAGVSNPIVPTGASVGHLAAEADDEFLFECFIDHPALMDIKNHKSPRMVLLGSTGVGKTAILRMIEKNEERCHNVELDELSLSYISNSDIIAFLLALHVPLDHFFQALWKHVICVEYIKLRYNVDSEAKSRNFFGRIFDRFSVSQTRQKALAYLKKWESNFWISFDESIKEITKNLESEISANFASEIEKFRVDVGYARKLSEERRTSLQQRLRKFVDADLLSELAQVINLLSEYDVDDQRVHYVLIDKLDDNWVSPSIKYHLIRSLIEALKSMRRIADLKVVVSMRSDLMEKVIHDTRELGFQSEKYEDYMLRMSWTSDQLKSLINKRINFLFRRKYSSQNVFFESIFPDKIGKERSFGYILDHSLMRPRDVITFVNMCLERAMGKAVISKHDVEAAERVYSENRRSALIDEWRPLFPAIEPTLAMIEGKKSHFPLHEITPTDFINEAVKHFFEKSEYTKDSIAIMIDHAMRSEARVSSEDVFFAVFERLYLVGAVGINTSPTLPVQWFFKTQRRLDKASLSMDSKVQVHEMLHSALKTRH